MGVISCPDCEGKVSESAASCPHCGCPDPQRNQPEKEVVVTAEMKANWASFGWSVEEGLMMMKASEDGSLLASLNSGPKCPLCGGNMQQISKGTAFGKGHILGAFMKSGLECVACGHLT